MLLALKPEPTMIVITGATRGKMIEEYLETTLRYRMRRPGFEPGLPDWQSDVLDQTGRPSQRYRNMVNWHGYITILLLGHFRFDSSLTKLR